MKQGYLIDMDGVIYRGSEAIPGAGDFIAHLHETRTPYLFLTNNSAYAALDVVAKLKKLGIHTTVDHVFTSALATAEFVAQQKPRGTAFVIGEGGLLNALNQVDYAIGSEAAALSYRARCRARPSPSRTATRSGPERASRCVAMASMPISERKSTATPMPMAPAMLGVPASNRAGGRLNVEPSIVTRSTMSKVDPEVMSGISPVISS